MFSLILPAFSDSYTTLYVVLSLKGIAARPYLSPGLLANAEADTPSTRSAATKIEFVFILVLNVLTLQMYGLRQVRFSRCKESNRISDNIDCSGTNVIATGRLQECCKIILISGYNDALPFCNRIRVIADIDPRTPAVSKSDGNLFAVGFSREIRLPCKFGIDLAWSKDNILDANACATKRLVGE